MLSNKLYCVYSQFRNHNSIVELNLSLILILMDSHEIIINWIFVLSNFKCFDDLKMYWICNDDDNGYSLINQCL